MYTTRELAEDFIHGLTQAFIANLSDPALVQARVAEIEAHARTFPEVRFCKGCVLPLVDVVTTAFFDSRLQLGKDAAYKALRCEGATTIRELYTPTEEQSGYSGFPWGTNYQPFDKSGRAGNYRPAPDFGIVHAGEVELKILGEVKYSSRRVSRNSLLNSITKDLRYYMGLPKEPEKQWDYDFGIGIAYEASGNAERTVEIYTDEWNTNNFQVILFRS